MAEAEDMIFTQQRLAEFYGRNFAYYRTLDREARQRFVYRCKEFIEKKEIIGSGDFVTNNIRKAAIAASAVQLTLGLDDWELDLFDTILVHPGDFGAHGGQKYRGLTGGNGLIQLSWHSFLHGYQINNDKLNLGLHEFSHALRFNSVRGNKQDYFVEHYFDRWLASAYPAYYDIQKGKSPIFRKYGGTNINEFMSVCIEHFFEAPEDIKKHYPVLYYSTAILLNQLPSEGKTRLNVRAGLFKEKSKFLPGYSGMQFATPVGNKPESKVMLVVCIPLLYTIVLTGPFSGPSLGLLTLLMLVFFRLDFYFKRVKLKQDVMTIERGLLFFKTRGNIVLPSSLLTSATKFSMGKFTEWEIKYFNDNDGYFYEETFFSNAEEEALFMKELLANKVAVYDHSAVYPY